MCGQTGQCPLFAQLLSRCSVTVLFAFMYSPQRLAEIVSLIPGLSSSTRLLDVGSGTGCLIPHLQARGVADITAVDLSAAMLEQLAARFPTPSVCGNDPGTLPASSTDGSGRA